MPNDKIPVRAEVPEAYKWKLEDLFESDEAWLAEYEALAEVPAQIAAFKGKLDTAEGLLAWFRLQDSLTRRFGRFRVYASCRSDEDTGNSLYQDFKGKSAARSVAIMSAGAFASPEIMAIPEETLEGFYKEKPELEEYRRSLYQIRRRAAHTLSPSEEKLLADAEGMADASANTGNVLRNADIRFPNVTDSEGNARPLSNGSFVPLLESSDRELRKAAFRQYYSVLDAHKNTLASTLDGQFKQLRFFAKARGYENTLEASLDRTEVPVPVYGALIDAVHANLDKMYRYVSLRKKLLGVEDVHMYDVYTPIVADSAREYSFEEARDIVLNALAVLGEDYTDKLKEGFANRWIDVYENVGKRAGAYSTNGLNPHPLVLMNFKGNLDSVFTLAHELGHSLHSYYSGLGQPVSTSRYVIFVAEVASTCNEVLLTRWFLNNTQDRNQKAAILNHFLDSFKGTLYRQTMFAEFEREMGQLSESGRTLTAELLCERYHKINGLYFGPEMVNDPEIALEWARIPHFFYNYYMFQYATGFSAAVAIADRILKEGAPAVADYKRFLSAGSSSDPISVLKIAGVDMSTPDPVNSALAVFGQTVDDLAELLM